VSDMMYLQPHETNKEDCFSNVFPCKLVVVSKDTAFVKNIFQSTGNENDCLILSEDI
jgi:hypothetical protein